MSGAKRMRLREIAALHNVTYATVYRSWAAQKNQLLVAHPTDATLDAFREWLTVKKHLDVAAAYPGVALSLVFELYRPEYVRAAQVSVWGIPVRMGA